MAVVVAMAVEIVLAERAIVGTPDLVATIGKDLPYGLAVQSRVDAKHKSCHAGGTRAGA